MRRTLVAAGLVALAVLWAAPAAAGPSLYLTAAARLTGFGLVTAGEGQDLRPGDYLTRAELARMVAMAAGLGDRAQALAGSTPFSDAGGHWASGYIAAAREAGLMAGYPDGSFRPEGPVTYGEVITVLVRVLGLQPEPGKSWPYNYIDVATASGVVPQGLPVQDYADFFAVRAAAMVLADGAFYRVQDGAGRNLYQRVFRPTPPRILLAPWIVNDGKTARIYGRVEGAPEVWVAGQVVFPEPGGNFSVKVALAPGANVIVARAEDLAGNQASAEVTVFGSGP